MKSSISTQFEHRQLLLMFCSKRLCSFLNLIQEQAIFTVSNDKICTFEIFVTMIHIWYTFLSDKDLNNIFFTTNKKVTKIEFCFKENKISLSVTKKIFIMQFCKKICNISLLTKFKIYLKPCTESYSQQLEGFHSHQNRKPCVISFKYCFTYAKSSLIALIPLKIN